MHARTGMTATAAILFVCGGAWLSARQGRPEQPPPFRTGTEVVSIDVGVVDKRGQPVRDLSPGDFTVTVGGQPRAVVSAEFVDLAPALAAVAAPPDTGVISTNEGSGVGRTILFVVDQNTLDLGAARQVARSSAHFFTGLTFADRSALALLPVGPNVQFTWAHARVSDALQRVVGTGGTRQAWEYGSLADARDISNTGPMALRTVGERECGGTSSAGLGSSSGGGGGGAAAPTGGGGGGPQGPTGGDAPAGAGGGETPGGPGGGGGAPGGATGGATGGQGGGGGTPSRGSGSSGGFGMNSCLRDLQMQADSAWRMAHATSLTSVTSLRQTLASLAEVRGDKTVILISGGWPLDQRDEVSLMSTVASEAAAVRATIHTIFVPATTFAADRRGLNFGSTRDQYIHLGPLETLASMTGGGTFRADVNADVAFETLRRELAGHYRIGVERAEGDVGAKNRRMKVQVSRSGLAVRARELFEVRSYEDRDWAARLASALESPVAATGVGLRMTSYLTSDPEDSERLKVVLTGEASRLQPGEATFQLLVRDLEGKAILSGEKPLGTPTGGTLPFSADVPVTPGSYIVRLAVMDGAGRVGSLDHRVEARPVSLGKLSASRPLLVRVPADRSIEPSVALDGVRQDERLALQVDLDGDREQLGVASVVFEIAPASGGAPLVQAAATLSQGSRNAMLAQSVADVRLLPPGPYMVHAKVTADGEALGEVRRAFTVMAAPRAAAASVDVPVMTVDGGSRPKFSARGTIPPFAVEQVLDPAVLGGFLDKVAARPDAAAPPIRALLERARTGGLDALDVPETLAADAPVAAFLQGLSLLARKKLDPAAISFRRAMNAAGDFYPAMVYLGACYAAGGRDKEAAGAWRTALIKEGDAIALHVLLSDSLLRQDRGDLALQTIDGARKRWPEDEGLKRRYAMAALLAGRYEEGFDAVDDLVAAGVEDEPSLALALLALYDAFSRGSAIEDVEQDRARMIRLADAYRTQGGPSLALVNAWVAAATLER